MVRFEKARSGDAERLAEVSKRAFDHDVHYGAPGPGGPPGYDSAAWQATGDEVWRLLQDRRRETDHWRDRDSAPKKRASTKWDGFYIEPEFQNQGIGTEAFQFLWEAYPLAKRWTLGTPAWNKRTRHFYKKVGFVEIGKDRDGGILFERRIQAGTRREGA